MLIGRQLFPPRSLTAPMKAGAVDGGPTVPRQSVSRIFPPLCAQRAFSGCPRVWPYTPFYAQGREIVLEEKPSQCKRLSSTSWSRGARCARVRRDARHPHPTLGSL